MTDSLRELVNARDRLTNEPKALRRLARSESTARRICVVCRRPQPAWLCRDTCPEPTCGGQLVEVA